jgi:hypothetical protein
MVLLCSASSSAVFHAPLHFRSGVIHATGGCGLIFVGAQAVSATSSCDQDQ